MFCPVCNTQIDDESARYCPNCNTNIKIAEQRVKVNNSIAKTGETLREIFRSKSFLTYCIILSVVCGLFALAFLDSLSYSDIVSAAMSYGLHIGFGTASLVAAWKLYSESAEKKPDKKLISQFKLFPTVLGILSTVAFVCMIIGAVAMAIAFVGLSFSLSEVGSITESIKNMLPDLEAQGVIVFDSEFTPELFLDIVAFVEQHIVIIGIIFVVIMIALAVFYGFEKNAYKAQKMFIENLESVAVTSVYMPTFKYSSKLLMAVGVMQIVVASPTAIYAGVAGVAPIMLGVLTIIASNLFKEMNQKLENNAKFVNEQRKILDSMMFEESMYQQSRQADHQETSENNNEPAEDNGQ